MGLHDQNLKLYKLDIKELNTKLISLKYTKGGFLCAANNKGKVIVYYNCKNDSPSIADMVFDYSNSFEVEAQNKYDYNWIKLETSDSPKYSDFLYCIANKMDHLLIYNCVTRNVS